MSRKLFLPALVVVCAVFAALLPAAALAAPATYAEPRGPASPASVSPTVGPAPTIAAFAPLSGPTAGGTSVTIRGTGFTSDTQVSFGGVAASTVTPVSSEKLICRTPSHPAGKVDIEVVTPGGAATTAGLTCKYYYTIVTKRQTGGPTMAALGRRSPLRRPPARATGRASLPGPTSLPSSPAPASSGWRLRVQAWATQSVVLDGNLAVTVHLSRATTAYKQAVWNTGPLPESRHYVVITWKATTGAYIDLDAFDVAGTLAPPLTGVRCEEFEPGLTWSTGWTTVVRTNARGSYKITNTNGAQVSFSFSGDRFALCSRKGPGYGKLSITIDGGTATPADLYASAPVYVCVYNSPYLKPGDHNVVIRRAGAKNTLSTGYAVTFDSVSIRGTMK